MKHRLTRPQLKSGVAAWLGWMFDGAEMGVFTLIGRAAVMDLLQTDDDGTVRVWMAVIVAGFLVGAATGGVLFGWLGDRIGRVVVLLQARLPPAQSRDPGAGAAGTGTDAGATRASVGALARISRLTISSTSAI